MTIVRYVGRDENLTLCGDYDAIVKEDFAIVENDKGLTTKISDTDFVVAPEKSKQIWLRCNSIRFRPEDIAIWQILPEKRVFVSFKTVIEAIKPENNWIHKTQSLILSGSDAVNFCIYFDTEWWQK